MQKMLAFALVAFAVVITGCDDSTSYDVAQAQARKIQQLERENTKLQQDLQTASSVSGTSSNVTILFGCALAATTFALIIGRRRK